MKTENIPIQLQFVKKRKKEEEEEKFKLSTVPL